MFSESQISETNEINKFTLYSKWLLWFHFLLLHLLNSQVQIDILKDQKRKRSDSHSVLFPAIKNIRSMCYLVLKWNPQIKGKFTDHSTHHILSVTVYKDHV